MEAAKRVASIDKAVDEIIRRTGGDIRLGLPLGLGKPNQLVNALYRRAVADNTISLTIYTALSLGRPSPGSDLEARFLTPFAERVFGDYEELDYLRAMRRDQLPKNVSVREFFFQPGSLLNSAPAQRDYISSNYTHVARDLDAAGVNVAAQMVAVRTDRPGMVSLSCNPEVSLDLMPRLAQRRAAGETIITIAQVHPDLPYMGNDAEVDVGLFDLLIDAPDTGTRLFSTPNMPVSFQDHLVGLNASALLRDGGMLQIGIGALGDALVHHTLRRQHDNQQYRTLLNTFGLDRFDELIEREGGRAPFVEGLYGCSEMFTHGLMSLVDGGVLRRYVYDDEYLQALINRGQVKPQATLATIDALRAAGALDNALDAATLSWLQGLGLVPRQAQWHEDSLSLDGMLLANDVRDPGTRAALEAHLDGGPLRGGTLMHGGFFLGPAAFYQRLRELSPELTAAINMTRISFINHLYGDEPLKRLQRRDGRFINTAFTVTVMGAAVADQLEDGRVLSGVGGQYNFVSQAHELEGARSILMLRAWRERGGEAASNIVWSYGHTTIPRHLRDIFVTEYGIADVRGKTDAQVIAALINIADSRFQDELLEQARNAGKIAHDYQVPEAFRYNTPERLAERAKRAPAGAFPSFPLGCDFTETEQQLLMALNWLKEKASGKAYLELGRSSLIPEDAEQQFQPHLERMGLVAPSGLRERLYRRLVLAALTRTVGR